MAPELRHTKARAGAEEGQLHRRCAVRSARRAVVIRFQP
jgi:hypothetical protein